MHQTEKDPRQGSPLSDVRVDLWRNTGQRGLLVASYKRLEKDSDGAITPAAVAVHVTAHLVPPGSPQAKQLRTLNSHWGRAATGKKILVSMHAGSLQ